MFSSVFRFIKSSGFSLGRLHMGGYVPPIWGQVQRDKALMGGGDS